MQARTPQVPFNRALAVLDSGYVGSMRYDLQILDTCNRHHACMRLLDKILQYIMYDEIKCWNSQHSEPQQEIFIARTTATEGVRFTVYPVQQVLEHHRSYLLQYPPNLDKSLQNICGHPHQAHQEPGKLV